MMPEIFFCDPGKNTVIEGKLNPIKILKADSIIIIGMHPGITNPDRAFFGHAGRWHVKIPSHHR